LNSPRRYTEAKSQLGIIDCIAEKADNLKQYTSRASNSLSSYDYEKIEKIIKNDEIMLKYLNCEIILEPQNDRFKSQRQAYQNCLDSFEGIKLNCRKKPLSLKNIFHSQAQNLKTNHNRAVILISNLIQQNSNHRGMNDLSLYRSHSVRFVFSLNQTGLNRTSVYE
jgi:hypothetical protein